MSVCPAKVQISLGVRPVWSVFAVRMKKSWVLSYPLSAQRRLWTHWANTQADRSLLWAHSHFVWVVMKRLILDFQQIIWLNFDMSHDMTKPTKWLCAQRRLRSATQISLGIRPVWSESSLCTQWVAKDPSFLHADSENSDQTGRTPRLIWVFAGCTVTLLVLSCRGSNKRDETWKHKNLRARIP